MSDKEEYMAKLDKLQRDVDWIISYLLKMNVSIQPPPFIPPSTKLTSVCSQCGVEWIGAMGYVCTRSDCVMQFKATWSSNSTSAKAFDVESLDPDQRTWYYDGDGTKRRKE